MGAGGARAIGLSSSQAAMGQHAALKKFIEGLEHFVAQRPILMLEEDFPALLRFLTSGADDLP